MNGIADKTGHPNAQHREQTRCGSGRLMRGITRQCAKEAPMPSLPLLGKSIWVRFPRSEPGIGASRDGCVRLVPEELSRRLVSTFLRDTDGRRHVYGGTRMFQD